MSRLDNFDEILGKDSGDSVSPKNKWDHDYEVTDDCKINGTFVYKDAEHILKVSYSSTLIEDKITRMFDLSIGSIQARLSKRDAPDMLESLVTAECIEKYQKHNMIPYVSLLEELYGQIETECEPDFEPYKNIVQKGIKKIIEMVKHSDFSIKDTGRNEPCYCGSGKKFKKCCGMTGLPKKEDGWKNDPIAPVAPQIDTSGIPSPAPAKNSWVARIKNAISGAALAAGFLLGSDHNSNYDGINFIKENFIKEKEPNHEWEKEDTPNSGGE